MPGSGAKPRPSKEEALTSEGPVQGQKGGPAHGEARGGGEDIAAGLAHPEGDGGQHGWRMARPAIRWKSSLR